jgi:hypothetical protein
MNSSIARSSMESLLTKIALAKAIVFALYLAVTLLFSTTSANNEFVRTEFDQDEHRYDASAVALASNFYLSASMRVSPTWH